MQLQKIAFQVVRIVKPLETRIQLRFAPFLMKIYRTVVDLSAKSAIQAVDSAGAASLLIAKSAHFALHR